MTLADNVSLYHCEDGTEFPVEWPSEEAAGYAWLWNQSHHPLPLTPLFEAIDHLAEGRERAWREAGVPAPPQFRGFTLAQGFQYTRLTPLAPEENQALIEGALRRGAIDGRAADVWEKYAKPRVQQACEAMRSAPLRTPVTELGNVYLFALNTTHVGIAALMPYLMPLRVLLAEHFGPEADLLAQELAQGGENDTVGSDQAIWELAQLASAHADAVAALGRSGDDGLAALESLPIDHPFRAAVRDYLAEFAYQAESWDIVSPTLAERPARLLEMVRTALNSPESPAAKQAAASHRREAAIARVEAGLRERPEDLARTRKAIDELRGVVGVREGRARWQLINAGSLHTALLARGAALVDTGVIAAAPDVLFLLPHEVDEAIAGQPGSLQALVEERRATWEYWKTKRPPHVLGTAPGGPLLIPPPIASSGAILKGIAGSRGAATGPARIILNLDQADDFQPGEVLVCTMTSPPWTPLFTIAAAVVTESGGPLSHPAITAREYGIPCVLGAKDATRKLRTGMLVSVDGGAGTVTIERE